MRAKVHCKSQIEEQDSFALQVLLILAAESSLIWDRDNADVPVVVVRKAICGLLLTWDREIVSHSSQWCDVSLAVVRKGCCDFR